MRWVIIVVLALAAAHFWAAAVVPVSPDEAYYWLWSRHPAIGYFDHPPMVAWWIWLGTRLAGDTGFGIRILTVMSSLGISAAVYAIGRLLFDRAIAERSVLWFNATLLFGLGAWLAVPDPACALFWTLALLAFVMLVRTGNGAWWLAVGAFAGLGLLSKYTIFFFGLGLVLALAIDRDLRRWLLSPWLWAGGAVAIAIFLPVLQWNAGHHWANFGRQFGRIVDDKGFGILRVLEFIGSEIGLINPFVALFVGVAAFIWLRRPAMPETRPIALLLATALPLLAYLVFHASHDAVQAHWPAPVFPTLAIAAAAAAGRIRVDGAWGTALTLARKAALPFGLVISLAGLAMIGAPIVAWPPPVDLIALYRGWPELAAQVDGLRQKVDAKWVATLDYGVNAELAYHLAGKAPVEQVVERIRYAFAPAPDQALGHSRALLLVRAGRDVRPVEKCFGKLDYEVALQRRGVGGDILQGYTAYVADQPVEGILARGCDRLH